MICKHDLPISAKCRQCFLEAMENEAEIFAKGHKPKSIKSKACKVCKEKFIPRRQMQSCCSYPATCEAVRAEQIVEKELARKARIERKTTIQRLRDMETLPVLKKRAQVEFNKFVRARDKLQMCITCDRPPPDMSKLHAGRDAGHYRSVGSAPHLRYMEDNCHAQCVYCNQHGAGRAVDYRIGLISRIGLARVEALEANNDPRHYTRDELIEIAAYYRKKERELKK